MPRRHSKVYLRTAGGVQCAEFITSGCQPVLSAPFPTTLLRVLFVRADAQAIAEGKGNAAAFSDAVASAGLQKVNNAFALCLFRFCGTCMSEHSRNVS